MVNWCFQENIGTVKFKKCDSVVEDFHLTCAKECLGDIQQVVVSSSMNSVQPFTSLFEKVYCDVFAAVILCFIRFYWFFATSGDFVTAFANG